MNKMNERFCLNTATIRGTPLDVQLRLAHEAGFRQIGLWVNDVEEAVAGGRSLSELKAQLDSCGLRVAEFCFLGGWQDAEGARAKEVLNRCHHVCNLARALGCGTVVAVPALGPGWLEGAADRFRKVCRAAAEYGVRIALEFPGIAAEVRDLRTARALVAAAACPNGGLVIDTFHFFLGGSTVADFDGMTAAEIFLVHVSDAMNLPFEELRIPHDNRTFPGEGVIDFAPIFDRLERLGYDGAVSLEIWNRKLHQLNPAVVVMQGRDSLQSIERMISQKSVGNR